MKLKKIIPMLLLSVVLADEGDITDFTLQNGLKVIIMEKHAVPVVSVNLWYDVGSHDEWDGIRGTAHLFEHMMFRGTPSIPDGHLDSLLKEVGGDLNASTSDDHTIYYERLPAVNLELAFRIEADRMQNLILNQETLDTEREVVHEEERQRSANPIQKLILKYLRSSVPEGHPYAETPIGIMEQLDTVSVATCQSFYKMYYAPNNAVLVIVGDVKPQKVKQLAENYFGAIARSKNLPENPDLSLPPREKKITLLEKSSFDIPVTFMGYQIPPAKHDDIQALVVLNSILSGGESSRLSQRLVRKDKIALFSAGQPITRQGPGLFFYFAVYFPHIKPVKIESTIIDELEKIKKDGVTEQELTKAQKQLLAAKIFERYSASSLANSLGSAQMTYGDYREYETEIERFSKVSSEDIKRVANTYFIDKNLLVMHISPENIGFGKKLMMRLASLFM
jgi:zinc protease